MPLSPRALVAAGLAGVPLAADLDLAASGRWTLAARAEDLSPDGNRSIQVGSKRVEVVTVRGPLEQRATMGAVCGGAIDGYDAIEARFAAAAKAVADAGGGRVVLDIDSPGGVSVGSIESARRMLALKEKLGVRVVSVADQTATSAAYSLGLVADEFHVPPLGRTASIGTVVVREKDAAAGTTEVFRSGKRKMRPNTIEDLDDEDRAQIQGEIDARAANFFAWVSERREVSTEDLAALEGAAMFGRDAARRGLVDGNLTAHEVIEMAETQTALAVVAESLGLAPAASVDEITARAKAATAALGEVAALKTQLATLSAAKLADEERARQEQAAIAATQARAAFVAEVKAACDAALLTPTAEKALVELYGQHGEPAARAALGAMKAATPIVPRSPAGGSPMPADATGALTEWELARAKQLGMTPAEYAAQKGQISNG